jgi:mRNA interferase HigB
MRVVKPSRIRGYAEENRVAASSLLAWLKIAQGARWENIAEVRHDLPSADGVRVASGRIVTVFNIGGNKYRLIVGINYRWGMVYILRFMTHAEYDKDKWKAEL